MHTLFKTGTEFRIDSVNEVGYPKKWVMPRLSDMRGFYCSLLLIKSSCRSGYIIELIFNPKSND